MHFCMDEFRLLAPLLLGVAAVFHYLRMLTRRLLDAERRSERNMLEAQRTAFEAPCALCAQDRVQEQETTEMREWMEHWLKNVAPLIGHNPDRTHPFEKRFCADGSGFVSGGRIYPLYPTPVDADYYRDPDGMRLATAEESKLMREGKL